MGISGYNLAYPSIKRPIEADKQGAIPPAVRNATFMKLSI
jgi:hypothetical protein